MSPPLPQHDPAGNERYLAHVVVPGGRLADLIIRSDRKLGTLLADHKALIKQRLTQCKNLEAFWIDLRDILEKAKPAGAVADSGSKAIDPARLETIMANMDHIGWDSLVEIDQEFTRLTLQFSESQPDQWFANILRGVQEITVRYQDAWDVLDDIDRDLWVLEPRDQLYGTMTRRIALEQLCSLELTIDPQAPLDRPRLRLYGTDVYLQPLRQRLRNPAPTTMTGTPVGTGRNEWGDGSKSDKAEFSLRRNLECLLGIKLPSKRSGNATEAGDLGETEEFSTECGICYSYEVKGVVPDQLCQNPKCHRPFHHQCLVDWLRADPSSRQSFSIIFGDCPYCSEEMSVSMMLT
ncbi:FANCL C-terminal domain-containing protein [Dimargaris cristalligena]|uniref:FANCL C-terminal domain-containing protein n=1 Tax=Dimargaris cristalligena TaxID=215637 RepID=A0A4Q0A0Z9_9FUNG|nr:FANCL C-terminal domain-containing protein [Dimargaris cristalligena]|eukprot:RKP39694.1 FANCL C-terminal domain-containing protein [Dimargaris cristalligena]